MSFLERNLNSYFSTFLFFFFFDQNLIFSYFKNKKKKQGPVLNQINSMAEKNAGAPSKGKGGKRR